MGSEDTMKFWIYLLVFNLAASFIRLKSLFHSHIEAMDQVFYWMKDQFDWVLPTQTIVSVSANDVSASTTALLASGSQNGPFENKKLCQIEKFLTLRRYSAPKGH